MLKIFTAFAAAALLTTATPRLTDACEGHDKKGKAEEKKLPSHMSTASFKVEGISCDGCADKVKSGLAAKDGIVKVEVATASARVTVQYDADKLDVGKIAKMLTDMGYKATAEA